ncbi:MAG: Molybdenum cofactor cytidylyltransferase [Candidatus Heimdallarchaeota archaeon LC_2]|nr:MAG: Molybdenum cofactor cytidylyltransferase [Candidatus Heimdallarchaeota archaeon LC_2]
MNVKLASLILAAGASLRFGENKFLTKLGDQSLLERTLKSFINNQELRKEVIVITGHYTKELEPILKKYKVKQIHNPSFNLGMSSSIQTGLDELKNNINEYTGILVHPGDIPFITSQDLDRLLLCHKASPNKIIIPKFNNKRGHPIIIPKSMFQELNKIEEDNHGLRGLIRASESEIKYVNVNNQGILEDVDTKKDLDELSHLR